MNHALMFNCHQMNFKRNPGPYRVATFLREHDWDVEVIEYTFWFTLEQLKELCRSRITSKTIFIGFGVLFDTWPQHVEDLTEWLKKTYPNIKLIYGSQGKCKFPCSYIDYFVHGYGEKALLDLIEHIVNNKPIAFDPAYFGRKKVISANKTHPSFPMKSAKILYQKRDFIEPWEWGTLELSRGCKFKCTFCNFPVLGVKGDYSRDADDFEKELKENYEQWGMQRYYISDETVNDRTEKIEKFAEVVDHLNWKPYFTGYVRADLLVSRPQDWEPMARLGHFGQVYGVETFNHESGKSIGKGMDPEKLQAGLLEARKYFLSKGAYRGELSLIVGLPHETKESQEKTFQWCIDNWQGESVTPWPLEITLNEEIDVPSFISKNWKQLGYREVMLTDEHDQHGVPTRLNWKSDYDLQFISARLHWENDHMSLDWARQCVSNWIERHDKENLYFTGTPWHLTQLDTPFDIAWKMPRTHFADASQSHYFIKKYIMCKLNWRPG